MKSLLKVGAVAPAVVASTALTTALVRAFLPEPAQTVLGCAGLVVAGLLICGVGEGPAVRVIAGGRRLTKTELSLLAGVLETLESAGLGRTRVTYYVQTRAAGVDARPWGRRSVLVSPNLLLQVGAGRVEERVAVAVLAAAALATTRRLTRSNAVLSFWTLPWTIAARCTRPLRGLLGFAWACRPVVAVVAVGQILTQPSVSGGDVVMAAGIVTLLALTYVTPACARAWERHIDDDVDELVLEHGYGRDYAAYLRATQPLSVTVLDRVARLEVDQTLAAQPRLRLVSSTG